MKILQIFGAVVAVHLLAFIFIFASPGCQSGPHNVPTPDATLPAGSAGTTTSFDVPVTPAPAVDAGTPVVTYSPASSSGYAAPTRPGSPAAVAVTPARVTEDIAPVSTYTVGKGDSLWTIAKKNHLTVAELAKANNLGTGAALQPGKKLIIPGKIAAPKDLSTAPLTKATTAATEKTSVPAASGVEAVRHTVLPGESLGVIARKYQVSTGELAAANNITDPSKVRAGQQLIIPGFKAVGSKGGKKAVVPSTASSTTPATTPTAAEVPVVVTPHFEITAPPPGQDLDAGLKDTSTEVPTIKVEDAPKK